MSINTPEFRELMCNLGYWVDEDDAESDECARILIAHIDSKIAAPADRDAIRDQALQWISVDERLPEDGKDVIILYWPYNNHENAQVAGTAHHVSGTFYDEDGNDMHPPSHWLPFNLPTHPSASPTATDEKKEGA